MSLPVIFLTAPADVPMSVKAMKSGADGVSNQAIPAAGPSRRGAAISRASSRPAREKERELEELRHRSHEGLSIREREVDEAGLSPGMLSTSKLQRNWAPAKRPSKCIAAKS